jgi:DNA polymerase III delta prime subunit
MKRTNKAAVLRLLFGTKAANRRQLADALIVLGLLVVPGLMLGALVSGRIWSGRQTPPSSRWGWSLLSAAVVAFVAPAVVWTWPGQVVGGGVSFGSIIGSTVIEAMLAPLAVQVVTWLREPPAWVAPRQTAPLAGPASASQAPPHDAPPPPPSVIHLGIDHVGRPADVDLEGEACVLVAGLPGAGKTTTLMRLAAEAVRHGWVAVVVDLKGSGSLGRSIRRLAALLRVPLYTVDRSDPSSLGYDPCSGDPSQISNKLVGAFDFTGIAGVYQQVALDAVTKVVAAIHARDHGVVTLGAIIAALQTDQMDRLGRDANAAATAVPKGSPGYVDHQALLAALARSTEKTRVLQEGLVGIQKRLAAVESGTFGTLLHRTPALDWDTALATPGIVYISLPALASPTDVELLGRVIIQDVKQLAERRLRSAAQQPRCLLIIDEFAALHEPTQLVDLVLQGREAGITIVPSTQLLPKTPALLHVLLGAGVVIAHRVAGPDAEILASQFGTTPTVEVTPSMDYTTGEVTRGTVRRGHTYAISPGQLRDLDPGQVALRVVRAPLSLRHRLVKIYREEV